MKKPKKETFKLPQLPGVEAVQEAVQKKRDEKKLPTPES